MNIELLKRYQELDKKRSEFFKQVKTTELYVNIEKRKEEYKKKQNEFQNIEEEIKRLCATLPDCDEKKKAIQLKLDELQLSISKMSTLEDIENIETSIRKLENDIYDLNNYEKCLTKVISFEDKNKYNMNQLFALNNECKTLRDNFEIIFNKAKEKVLIPIENEMNSVSKQLNPEEVDMYKELKISVEKFPYVVEFDGEYCGGCGEDISSEVSKYFVSKDVTCRCPRCQRLLYIK